MGKKTKYTVAQERPICINHGCENLCHNGGKKDYVRFRPVCNICHQASMGKREYQPGVRPFRTGICSNYRSEHLGFPCATDYIKATWAIGMTHMDHIDGNRFNNTQENCQELCQTCHTYKGKINGDHRNKGSKNKPASLEKYMVNMTTGDEY